MSVDADHLLRLIAARAPEILPSDRDLIEAALNGHDAEIMERIADVIDALDERFAAMETRLDRIEEAA
jgi:hypothetical protein